VSASSECALYWSQVIFILILFLSLPQLNESFFFYRCWVAGWGQDSFGKGGAYQRVLKHIDVPVVPADECEIRLRDTKLGQYFQLDRRSFICAGGEPQKDACTVSIIIN
jgi:hypothetical protein